VIRMLAQKYALPEYNNVVTAIELLNEPLGVALDMNKVRQYWMDGWGITREYGDIAVVIGDAFLDPPSWNGFMSSGWNNVILDTHKYQIFSPGEVAMNINDHVGTACGAGYMLRTVDKVVPFFFFNPPAL
jgi:glucan 1,3-beta-glucosidase